MQKTKAPAREPGKESASDVRAPHGDVDALLRAKRAHAHSLDLLGLMLLCQRETQPPQRPILGAANG